MGFYIEDQVRKELLILMHKKGRKGNVYSPSILYEAGSWQWILNFSSSTKLSLVSYLWRHHQKIERSFYQFMSEVKVKLFLCKPRRRAEQMEVWHHFILTLALDGGGDELHATATCPPGKSSAFIHELAEWATEAFINFALQETHRQENSVEIFG